MFTTPPRDRYRSAALGLSLALLVGFATETRAQETALKLDQVPKAVTDSAQAKFPGARIKGAAKEVDEGKTVIELEMTHENHQMDVTFTEDGTLVLVETVAPAKVREAVMARYPGAKVDLVESVKKGPKVKAEVDYYEFHVTTAGKTAAELEVDPQGKVLKTEEAKAKD
jgi:hypothetical protein